MKILIASDAHGSLTNFDILLDRIVEEKPDSIVLLGDLYYHGPRNPLPDGYNPLELSKRINAIKLPLTLIKGNCDSEVDQMITTAQMYKNKVLTCGNLRLFMTHGHKYNADNPPPNKCDVLFHGHTHICKIDKREDVIYVNIGSISLPKEDSPKCYCVVEDGVVIMKTLEGEEFMRKKIAT